jgi:hypothetical protein
LILGAAIPLPTRRARDIGTEIQVAHGRFWRRRSPTVGTALFARIMLCLIHDIAISV